MYLTLLTKQRNKTSFHPFLKKSTPGFSLLKIEHFETFLKKKMYFIANYELVI